MFSINWGRHEGRQRVDSLHRRTTVGPTRAARRPSKTFDSEYILDLMGHLEEELGAKR
jgi:hypothetical protein